MSVRSEEPNVSLVQNEEPFLATFALVGLGVAHLALDGKFRMVNHRLCQIAGHTQEELLAKSLEDIAHPEESREWLVDPRLLAGEVQTASLEKKIIRSDGQTAWIRMALAPVRDENTRDPRYLFAVIEDISAQKEAQQALRESEERFRLLVQLAPEAVLVMDPADNRLVEANRKAEELFGCTREELLSSGLLHFYDVQQPGTVATRATIDEHNRQALAGEEVVFERVLHNARGEHRYCEVRLAPFPSGQRTLILGSYFDITERKRTEELLRRQVEFDKLMTGILTRFGASSGSEVRASITEALRQLAQFIGVDHAHVVIFSADRSTWSATHEWCGPNVPAQIATFQDVPFGLYPLTESRLLAGQVVRINTLDEYPLGAAERNSPHKKAGATSKLTVPIHGTAGVITGAVGVDSHSGDVIWADEDVARCKMVGDAIASLLERERAGELLRKSEEKFAKAFEASPAIKSIVRLRDRRFIEVNRAFEQRTGYSRDEVHGRSVAEVGQLTDVAMLDRTFEKLIGERSLSDLEVRLRNKAGTTLTALLSAEIVEVDGEECVLIVADDITARKQAEQALRESEQRFRVMADCAPVMMWMSGTDKQCTDFNRGWLAFTGRTIEQESGDGWADGVHPADLQKCLQTYEEAFDRRQSFTMEYRLRRHDGQYRWISDIGVPRFLPDGSFAGYIGCCIDIEEQRVAERTRVELARRLMTAQEAERARIARELHDDIGQSLALLGIQLERSSHPPSGAPHEKRVDARELRDRVKAIGNKVSRISHQLHSSELEYLGLAVAVKSLCREFSEQYHVEVECSCEGIPAELDGNVALGCLRVIQEALHNIAKHSHAADVQVEVIGDSEGLSLLIADDGTGFDTGGAGAGAGLGLISMRERMHLMGGDFMISSSPGNGTRIKARAPLAADTQRIASPVHHS
jgi:PAS domain S-box-containing protein